MVSSYILFLRGSEAVGALRYIQRIGGGPPNAHGIGLDRGTGPAEHGRDRGELPRVCGIRVGQEEGTAFLVGPLHHRVMDQVPEQRGGGAEEALRAGADPARHGRGLGLAGHLVHQEMGPTSKTLFPGHLDHTVRVEGGGDVGRGHDHDIVRHGQEIHDLGGEPRPGVDQHEVDAARDPGQFAVEAGGEFPVQCRRAAAPRIRRTRT